MVTSKPLSYPNVSSTVMLKFLKECDFEDKESPYIEPIYLIVHSNLLTNLNLMKQEFTWLFENQKKIKNKDFDKYWQNYAERIRELLFIAKQSMNPEQYPKFKALVKMTLGTGYITNLEKLLGKNPKIFLDFDEANL
jgi:hypothetical protein